MEYATNAQGSPAVGGAMLSTPQSPRVFDGISTAVGRLRGLNEHAQEILDRIQPTPRDATEGQQAIASPRQPHVFAIQDLHGQLDRLGQQLDQLDKFI